MFTKRKKQRVITESQRHEKDTGSPEVQIAVLSKRIDELTAHLKKHKKDNHSRRGLLGMVAARRKHLTYVQKKNPGTHDKILKKLKLK